MFPIRCFSLIFVFALNAICSQTLASNDDVIRKIVQFHEKALSNEDTSNRVEEVVSKGRSLGLITDNQAKPFDSDWAMIVIYRVVAAKPLGVISHFIQIDDQASYKIPRLLESKIVEQNANDCSNMFLAYQRISAIGGSDELFMLNEFHRFSEFNAGIGVELNVKLDYSRLPQMQKAKLESGNWVRNLRVRSRAYELTGNSTLLVSEVTAQPNLGFLSVASGFAFRAYVSSSQEQIDKILENLNETLLSRPETIRQQAQQLEFSIGQAKSTCLRN